MVDATPPLPGLSPVAGKALVARFDGGRLSSDGGLLVLREVEQRLRMAERLAACIQDPRDPERCLHTLTDIIGFRLLAIAAGYADGNDATRLRTDPAFKMALDRLPSGRDLCSQATISRLENLPDARTLLRMGRAMVDLYCASFRQVPQRIVLDLDDTFDAVHGTQQLRLFNAYCDEYGFQPMVVFDGEGRFVTALLRPAKRPSGVEIRAFLRRLVRAIRANWPKVTILLRADGHYACPEVMALRSLCDRLLWRRSRDAAGARPRASTMCWGLPRRPRCAGTSPLWRRAPRCASRLRPAATRCAASRSSMTGPTPGAGSGGSLPGSRRGR